MPWDNIESGNIYFNSSIKSTSYGETKNDHRINVRKNMDIYCIKIKKAFEFFVSYEMLVSKMSWVLFRYFNDQPVYHCKIFIKKMWEYWRKIWSTILGQQIHQLNRHTNWV